MPLRLVDAVKLKQELAPLIPSYADLSANAASNSLIMTDTETNVRRVMQIVKALDTHMSGAADVKVFPLKYASAASAARLINEVFREDTTSQQQQAVPFFGGFGRFRMPGAPGGPDAAQSTEGGRTQRVRASADDRSNTVVVTGPADVLRIVESVMRDLDSNPQSEKAVMQYRLKNAKAATLKTVLNDLFTDRSTTRTGTTGVTATGRTQQQQQQQQRTGQTTGQTAARAGQTTGAAVLSDGSVLAALDMAGQVYVAADTDSNTLLIMAPGKFFQRIKQIVEELDRDVPQVLIKVLIAEVSHTNTTDLGMEFSVLNMRPSGRGSQLFTDFDVAEQSGGVMVKLLEKDITGALRALQKVGKMNVLSRPYILASDNQQAKITVGREVPFITNTRTTETGQTLNTIQYQDIGIILVVTAHINPEGTVILDVAPEVSALTGETVPISETVSAPVFAKRSASSRVGIRDGQTIVIGGLMEDKKTDTINKVPLLGDIPLLGALFRRTINEVTKTELLIFLTPHVAQAPTALDGMSKDETAGSKIPGSLEPGAFDKHMEGMKRGAARTEEAEGATTP
jgi:general secretion pathway protein D